VGWLLASPPGAISYDPTHCKMTQDEPQRCLGLDSYPHHVFEAMTRPNCRVLLVSGHPEPSIGRQTHSDRVICVSVVGWRGKAPPTYRGISCDRQSLEEVRLVRLQ